MHKAHRIRLNPTGEQQRAFMRAAGVARFAYNWALTEYKRRKAAGEPVDWNAVKKEFRARIDAEFPFVREVTKCAAEEGIADCRRAIHIYFEAKRRNPKLGLRFPGLRRRSRRIGGFGLANDKFALNGHEVLLPRIGTVNMAEPVRFSGTRHDRDGNAAITLHLEGLALLAGSGYVGVTPVELAASTLTGNGQGKRRAAKQELDGAAHSCTPKR